MKRLVANLSGHPSREFCNEPVFGFSKSNNTPSKSTLLLCMKGISDIHLNAFNHGGMNVTGFKIVDHRSQAWRDFNEGTRTSHGDTGCIGWESRDPAIWPGAGRPLSVRRSTFTDQAFAF